MEKNHNDQYEELQAKFLETRDKGVLSQMYLIAFEAAKNYINNYCKTRKLRLDVPTISHDAASYCIDKYLKRDTFKIDRLSSYVYFGVAKALYSNKEQEMNEVSFEALFDEKNKDN